MKITSLLRDNVCSFLMAILVGLACSASLPEAAHYGPAVMIGRLEVREVYGPPGFGEDPRMDKKVKIWVLVLDKRITVSPLTGESDEINRDTSCEVSEIQLEIPPGIKLPESGLPILVKGVLEEGVASGEFLDVVMKVQELKVLT